MPKKVNEFVSALRTFVDESDKDVLVDLGLIHPEKGFPDSMLIKLHRFEQAAFELLLAIDEDNLHRRFG